MQARDTLKWSSGAVGVSLGAVAFLMTIAWPALALLERCISDGTPPNEGFMLTERHARLLAETLGLSVAATVAAHVLAIPGAMAIAQAGQLRKSPWLSAALCLLMLSPPMVLVWGWENCLPKSVGSVARCLITWALWLWPIPALVLGNGWSSVGRANFESALLVTTPTSAFLRIGLPALRRHLFVSCTVTLILLMNDYATPHACGLQVYATELLGWASSSTQSIDTLWPSMPIIVLTVGLIILVSRESRGLFGVDTSRIGFVAQRSVPTLITWGLILISLGFPLVGLTTRAALFDSFSVALQTYGRDLAYSLLTAALAGLTSIAMGIALTLFDWSRRWGSAIAVIFGALPGALVGVALIAAYNRPVFASLYDHWLLVSLAYVARFGWIGVLLAVALMPRRSPLIEQATVDGAGRFDRLIHVQIPAAFSTFVGGFCIVTALALSDVAASTMVRSPSFNPIAHVLIEKFHRFEEPMLVAISLWLVLVTLPGVVWVLLILRSRRGLP